MAEPGMAAGAVAGQLAMGVDDEGNAVHVVWGTPADDPWDGVTANPTVFALLKAIAINTTPAP